MQYILTQAEFNALKEKQEVGFNISVAKLQALCTLISDTMPVKRSWENDPDDTIRPWGCIHTPGNEGWKCDECPVQTICPGPKSWSK